MNAFPKIFHIGEELIPNLFQGPVEITEKIDGCVTPETPILLSDLRYISASELKVGDKLIGFEETLNNSRFKESVVTCTKPVEKECYKITLVDGRVVISSIDHPWVVRFPKRTSTGLSKKYVVTEELKVGYKIVDFGYFEQDKSYEAGYVAGQFDGEGTLVGTRKSGREKYLAYYQKEGDGALVIKDFLERKGFEVGYSKEEGKKEGWKSVETLRVNRGLQGILKFLGTFRPQRLLKHFFDKLLVNTPFNAIKDIEVIKIEPIGIKVVIGLSTTTKTYIANGLCCHNSQFCFGLDEDGERAMRSKNQDLSHVGVTNLPKMFVSAYEVLYNLVYPKLEHLGWDRNIYFYTEHLDKSKHNTLAYTRIPKNHLYLFGMQVEGVFTSAYQSLIDFAHELGIEPVNVLYYGTIGSVDELKKFLELESVLGKEKVEGVVVKNYSEPVIKGHFSLPISMGKFVQANFRERNSKEFVTSKSKLQEFMDSCHTEARWQKAISHLRDSDLLTNSPKDIGPLLGEIARDLLDEEEDFIKNSLYKLFKQEIARKAQAGFPEWYKEKLLERSFEN